MISWNETRYQSIFENWFTSETNSYLFNSDYTSSDTRFTGSISDNNSSSGLTSASNGQTTTEYGGNSTAVTETWDGFDGFPETVSQLFSASGTVIANLTETRVTQRVTQSDYDAVFSTLYSSTYTYTNDTTYTSTGTVGVTYVVSTASTSEWDYTVTTTLESTTSVYTSSTTSSTTYSGTSTETTSIATSATTSAGVTLTTNQITGTITLSYDTGTLTYTIDATSSAVISITSTATSSDSITAPVELGTVISAENTDWLWSFSNTPSVGVIDDSLYFLSQIASSFTLQTFWNVVGTSVIPFAVESSISYTNPDSTTAFSYQVVTNLTDTYSTSVTTGDEFPRVTTSTTFYSTTISDIPFTDGAAGGSAVVNATSTSSFTSQVNSTTTSTVLYPIGFDQSTTTISVQFPIYQTYYETVPANYMLANQTIQSTSTIAIGIGYSTGLTLSEIFQPVPQEGGFRTPDAMAQTDGVGANLSISPAIYYPFTSSVQQNVVVPIPTNTTAMQTDTNQTGETTFTYGTDSSDTYTASIYTNLTSWIFQWSSFGLSYTSATSYTASTSTVTYSVWDSSSGTASFITESAMSETYWQGAGPAFGGYSPVSSVAELGEFIGGVNAISYDTAGSTTSESTNRTALGTSTLMATIRVENLDPVYITSTNGGGGVPVISFTR